MPVGPVGWRHDNQEKGSRWHEMIGRSDMTYASRNSDAGSSAAQEGRREHERGLG
jgi:hypothetical protein